VTDAVIDTDVIIRLVTGDDSAKQARGIALFRRVELGEVTLIAPDTVVADAVYVLSSPRNYGMERSAIRSALHSLIRLPGFVMAGKPLVLRALDIWVEINVDFGDAMIVAAAESAGIRNVFSFDRDFDRFRQVQRIEP